MKTRFRVVVHPGLLQRDKWGVYLIPVDQPDFELTETCGIATREQAIKSAENISEKYQTNIVFEEGVTVKDSALYPKGEYEQVTADQTVLSGYLVEHFEDMFKQINKLRPSRINFEPKKWLTFLLKSPPTLALIGILVYYFSFDINAPNWLGSILPDKLNSSSQFILAIPLLMSIYAVMTVFRRRSLGYKMNVLRNYLLTLIFKYNWRLEEIIAPFAKEMGKIEHSAFSQIVGRWHDRDPDAFKNIMPGDVERSGQTDEADQNDTIGSELRELYDTLLKNDFERRVHALLFLEKEAWYSPKRIQFDPYNFLASYESRSVQFQVIKQISKTGGTIADVHKLYFQQASFRTVMHYLGATITFVVLYGIIGFALYLGVQEAVQQSLSWIIISGICSFFALTSLFQPFYRVYLKCQGRPRGFYVWEIGSIIN
jgi:hypothetical protein